MPTLAVFQLYRGEDYNYNIYQNIMVIIKKWYKNQLKINI
jgi:hypothetical protein